MKKRNLVLAISGLIYSGGLWAQGDVHRASHALEEVVVTAQKRAESIQDVPLAIESLTGDDITNAGVSSLGNLEMVSPSVIVSNQLGNVQTYIRGLGSVINGNGIYNSVAVYLDDVYMPRPVSALFDLSNIDSVQVLKGPQGALYGRNATGGALIVTTKSPQGGDEASGKVSVGFGSDSLKTVTAYIGGGLTDSVGGSLALSNREQDGYIDAPGGEDFGAEDAQSISAKLVWNATDTLTASIAVSHSESEDSSGHGMQSVDSAGSTQFLGGLIVQSACQATADPAGCLGAPPNTILQAAGAVTAQANFDAPFSTSLMGGYIGSFSDRGAAPGVDGNLVGNQDGGFYASEDQSATLKITKVFETFDLVSVSGYRSHLANATAPVLPVSFDDGGATLAAILSGLNPALGTLENANGGFGFSIVYDNESISQEVRLVSTDSDIDWIVGAEYFEEEGDSDVYTDGFGISTLGQRNTFTQTAVATFGQATLPVADDVSFTFGMRYTDEENRLEDRRPEDAAQGFPIEARTATFEQFTGTATLDWTVDETLYYASLRSGFKSGAQNVNNASDPGVDPEELISYEVGFKSELLDGQVRFNGAAFVYDFDNIHLSVTEPSSGATRYIDGATSEILGLELDVEALLTQGLTVDASIVVLDAEYTSEADIPAGAAPISIQGNRVPGAADLAATLGLTHVMDFEQGELSTALNLKYSSGHYFDAENLVGTGGAADGSYTLANLSVSYRDVSGWSARAYVNNLMDEEYFNSGLVVTSIHRVANAAPGREVGMSLGYEF